MENRIATVLVLVEERQNIPLLNQIISSYAEIIIGRQGIRLPQENRSIISLVIDGSTDEIGGLTGKLGQLQGIKVKSLMLKNN